MEKELFTRMVLDAWNQYIKRTTDLFNELTEEQLLQPVATGRNRGIYLLGHLVAVHDRILPLLEFGDQQYPELAEPFVSKADGEQVNTYSVNDLKRQWNEVNAKLGEHFARLSPERWFTKHTAVSDEDFKKEPHRNKLNLVINRTNHLASHYGQLVFLKPRKSV